MGVSALINSSEITLFRYSLKTFFFSLNILSRINVFDFSSTTPKQISINSSAFNAQNGKFNSFSFVFMQFEFILNIFALSPKAFAYSP